LTKKFVEPAEAWLGPVCNFQVFITYVRAFTFCPSKHRYKANLLHVGACMSRQWLSLREYSPASIGISLLDGPIFLGRPAYYRLCFYYSASINLLSTGNVRPIKNEGWPFRATVTRFLSRLARREKSLSDLDLSGRNGACTKSFERCFNHGIRRVVDHKHIHARTHTHQVRSCVHARLRRKQQSFHNVSLPRVLSRSRASFARRIAIKRGKKSDRGRGEQILERSRGKRKKWRKPQRSYRRSSARISFRRATLHIYNCNYTGTHTRTCRDGGELSPRTERVSLMFPASCVRATSRPTSSWPVVSFILFPISHTSSRSAWNSA